jgi:Domain of unknown function DUF29
MKPYELKQELTLTLAETLYERDFNSWLEDIVVNLRARDFERIDIDNLIEEIEGLANRDRREVETRLKRLIEHILKRCYVNMPECYRGWEVTIINQRDELQKLLIQSPSLKRHFTQAFNESFATALKIVQTEYTEECLPDKWQFSLDIEVILNNLFWIV